MQQIDDKLIEIKNLQTTFFLDANYIKAVDGISFNINKGKTLGIIGESGCGKSVTAQSILRIVPSPQGKIIDGEILLYRQDENESPTIDITKLDSDGEEMRKIRGADISMIFQEPMSSFSPLYTIGNQIIEAIRIHNTELNRMESRNLAIRLLKKVGLPMAEERIDNYPHQFSGGMRQRAMIAMALSCSPKLLIADEPTTSLDVTIAAQILELLRSLQEERRMSIMLITHNLAVVSELADDVLVMYLGKEVEYAAMKDVFEEPLHPYTKGLWRSIPKLEGNIEKFVPIKGSVPSSNELIQGCTFGPRCDSFMPGVCDVEAPPIVEVKNSHFVQCYLYS